MKIIKYFLRRIIVYLYIKTNKYVINDYEMLVNNNRRNLLVLRKIKEELDEIKKKNEFVIHDTEFMKVYSLVNRILILE